MRERLMNEVLDRYVAQLIARIADESVSATLCVLAMRLWVVYLAQGTVEWDTEYRGSKFLRILY